MNAILAFFMLLTPVPFYHMTHADLLRFILQDQTDKMEYGDNFGCIGFTETLVRNAQGRGFMASGVLVYMDLDGLGNEYGHEFAQFHTDDRYIVWIEPQTDEEYIVSYIGQKLCTIGGYCLEGTLKSITPVFVNP